LCGCLCGAIENAGVENARVDRRGGNIGSGKCGSTADCRGGKCRSKPHGQAT